MKKIVISSITLFLIVIFSLFADEARVKELIQQNQQIDQRINQYQKEIERLTILKIENNGRLKELGDIEKAKKETDEKNLTNTTITNTTISQ